MVSLLANIKMPYVQGLERKVHSTKDQCDIPLNHYVSKKNKNTMRTILVLFFTTTILFAQDYQVAGNDYKGSNFDNISERHIAADLSVSGLSLEIYDTTHFDYGAFLEDAKTSEKSYLVAGERYRKSALVLIFRKGALASEGVLEFEQYLKDIDAELLRSISERESVSLYYKFREGALKSTLQR